MKKAKRLLRGHHTNCHNWDYETHPAHAKLAERCEAWIEKWKIELPISGGYCVDMRGAHKFLFQEMAPAACRYIAGTFRGTAGCACLIGYECGIPGSNPRVGLPSAIVNDEMIALHRECEEGLSAYENWKATLDDSDESKQLALLAAAELLAFMLQKFLTVHPFANGNGHAGRLLVAAQIIKLGYWLGNWPVEEAPEYTLALHNHRSGDPRMLVMIMLWALSGAQIPLRSA